MLFKLHAIQQSISSLKLSVIMERWNGKVAIVTGASAGIGEAIVRSLVFHGLNVLGLARREDRLQKLSQDLKQSKGTFYYLRCDVENEEDILKAFAFVNDKFGSVDILINNAGIVKESFFEHVKTEDLRAVLNVNVLAPAIYMREALKMMRQNENETHIIDINSMFSINRRTTLPLNIYPASKFALQGMIDTFRGELEFSKVTSIRVTSIYVGLTSTEIFGDSTLLKKMKSKFPSLKSSDVADSVVFVLSTPSYVQNRDTLKVSVLLILSDKMERWAGKVAIITGGSAGIGEAIVRSLLSYGLNVLAISNRQDQLENLFNGLKEFQNTLHYKYCDIQNEKDILNVFEYVNDKLGGVDILINNAGIIRESTFANVKTEEMCSVFNVNVLAPAIFIREALKIMREQKNDAHIININSKWGIDGAVAIPVNIYPASKYALRGMTDTLKEELIWAKDDAIRVTSIYPGLVATGITGDSMEFNKLLRKLPQIQPKDVADCVVFALSAPHHVQLETIVVSAAPKK
ncbi:uncharacterized protein LOC141535294 [Cotesia typhae]|uniref:uncharacterized protein LOC141535294 n=1 Tax=Cotesia typhae TaxID=2053667 RepID=UPI003D684D69